MDDKHNLLNQRFGRWAVIDGPVTYKNKSNRTERKWLCRCDCGTVRYVLERSLLYGGSGSCGCATIENSVKTNSYELAGHTYGNLTVLCKAEGHAKDARGGIWWRCKCVCGNECDVLASLLVTGRKTHCGCKSAPPKYYYRDITGQVFNRLTALYPTQERTAKGQVIWHCRCECGKEVDVGYNELVYCDLQSCGCKKKEHDELMQSFLTRIDGTSLDMIKSKKIPIDNTSEVKGVYFQKGKWIAKIVFQKKQFHLGKFERIEDAAEARKAAEELIFDGSAKHYQLWKERAEADPQWAEDNPIRIRVKKTNGVLSVSFFPNLLGEKGVIV